MQWEHLADFFASESFVIIAGALGALIASVAAAVAGVRRGKPSPPAVSAAIEAPRCGAPLIATQVADLSGRVERLIGELDEVSELARRNRETLIRIEDRTRRD